jgi:3-keto-disaccharide hydrolase
MKSMRIVLASCVAAFALIQASAWAQSPGAWKTLFNGKDLTGWTVATGRGRPSGAGSGGETSPAVAPAPAPLPSWKVEEGVLVGGQGPGRGSLVSTDQFKDFELELDFMLAEHGAQCSAEHVGPNAENASLDKTCTYNSGISFRTGYQLNLGRREAGEYIGIVVHRQSPEAIRGNVLWLDKGDADFPKLRKIGGWNHVRITFTGAHLQVWLNGQAICDVTDTPTDPSEAAWREAGPISLQWPPASEAGGFVGFVKYRNIRIRTL